MLFLAIPVVAVALFFAVGPERIWRMAAGDPDLGAVDFDALPTLSPDNTFLMCPDGACPGHAANEPSPTFGMAAGDLRKLSQTLWQAQPRTRLVASSNNPPQDRYIQRTAIMRFPDTVSARFYDLPDGRSTLAILSRSQLGRSDLGANGKRVRAWVSLLTDTVNRKLQN